MNFDANGIWSQFLLRKRDFICLILAFPSVYALEHMLKISPADHVFSNSLFSLLAFVGIFFLLRKAWGCMNRRLAWFSGLLGGFFSACMVSGSQLLVFGSTRVSSPDTWLRICAGIPLFMALVALLLNALPQVNRIAGILPLEQAVARKITPKKAFFLCWGLIFLAWLPGLIATYPGVYGYDCVFQISGYLSGEINLSHPFLHTCLLSFCVVTLGNLLGSAEAGLLVYSLFQMLCLSASFALVCSEMVRRKLSVLLSVVFLGLFMFLPTHAIFSFTATKDVIYTAFFIFLSVFLLRLANQPERLRSRWFCVLFLLFSLLGMLFRKQGVAAFLFGVLFGLFFLRKYRKRLFILSLVCLLLFGVISGPIAKLCGGVEAQGVGELMSVPCVQLSRVRLYCSEELTEEECALIDAYVPAWQTYSFNAGIADLMKRSFDSARFQENPWEFFRLYLKVGLKCPLTYWDAFCRLNIGYWYPDMNYPDPAAYHPYWEYTNTKPVEGMDWVLIQRKTPEGLQWLADFYSKLTYGNSYQKIPVVSMLFSSGAVIWSLLLYVAWGIYTRKYRLLLPAMPALGLLLLLLFGPVVIYRYIYPLVALVPLLIGTAIAEPPEPERN